MKKNIQKSFLQNISRKTFYLTTLFALVAVAVVGFLLAPNSATKVSAQDRANVETATADMIAISLNTKSAGSFAIFADKAVSDTGNSQIRGNVGVSGKDAKISLESASVQGNTYVSPEDALRAHTDLASSFNAINQLPCVNVADSDLGGKKFGPGVYCVSSARLAGEMVLDAQNDPSATFIFRVSGSFNTKGNSNVSLTNQATAGNVYFVASDSANIGAGSSIKGSVFAENFVKVDNGATINGRVLSLKGGVTLDGANVILADGYIEICKAVDPLGAGAINIQQRVFQFNVTGVAATIEVQANQCSGPILVPGAGNVVVTEANTSRAVNSTALVPGNFQLVDVRQINVQQGAANAVTGYNLPLRTANVTVPMGGIASEVTVRFTNQFAIVGFIEICKNALDSDVTGFFNYTIDGVPQQTSVPATPLQVFTVPVGACAGPIAVTVPSDGTGTPRSGVAVVRELARVGSFFVMATTDPTERLISYQIVNNGVTAGIVNGIIYEAANSSNQTRFNFFNRSAGAQVKVCKVAGSGIAEGTLFNFTVSGTAPVFDPNTGAFSTVAVTRTFDVGAGLAANGGGCRFVPDATLSLISQQNFVVGTNVTITENGPTDNGAGVEIRVARITSSSGFAMVGTGTANPCALTATGVAALGTTYYPPNGTCRTVVVPVRASVVTVEYTNYLFRPGSLKICKVAGTGITQGTNYTFNVTVDRLQGTFGTAGQNTITVPVTVAAGPAAQGGFCTVVNGPFTPTYGGFGTFNVGSVVTVAEVSPTGTTVSGIRSTSGAILGGTTLGVNGSTTAVIQFGTTNNGVYTPATTEVEVTNSTATPQPGPERPTTAFDFDGDKKADISVFRDGNWYLNRSNAGFTANQFGTFGDRLVTADYDGDHKADIAVFRADPNKGYFYVLGSSDNKFSYTQFGINTDIPVVGDYDGDGKSDIAVYRGGKNLGDASYIYYRPSGTPGVDFVTIQLGAKGDVPVVGDYDGDGKTDAAVYRPSNGVWYMLRSRDGFTAVQFGISTDVPVAADYDGDGKTDPAVYRGGTWYLLQSSKGFTGVQFGAATDLPVPADIDGDGKDDITVFRAGTWYWLNSRDGSFKSMNFGIASDIPVFCPASQQ